jgi:monoamine oxidase
MSAVYRQWDQWEDGQGDFHPKGSYASLVSRLAWQLHIVKDEPVEEVRWHRNSVEVVTASGGWHRARCAIITLPLGVLQAGKVRFIPPLPRHKRVAIRDLGVGKVVKVFVRVDSFAEGVGYALSDCAVPVWWPRHIGRNGVLVGWAAGHSADTLSDGILLDVKCRAAQSVGAIFPRLLPVRFDDIHVVDWSREEFSRGGYSYTPTGCDGDTLRAALAAPEGNMLLFAGEATDGVYFMTVTGAARSGRRAAQEALRILG